MAGAAYTRADITPRVPALKVPELPQPRRPALWSALGEGEAMAAAGQEGAKVRYF